MFTEAELDQFTGTENYYKSDFGKLKLTDGVQWLRESGAAWLINVIESYQGERKVKNVGFQLWTITVGENRKALVTMREDNDTPVIIRQVIECTNCPCNLKLYVIDGVCLLPSEY